MALHSCQHCAAFHNCRNASELPAQCTILLVEDEPFIREATRSILQNAGFDVLPADDAPMALQVYEEGKRRVDLVMTDMVLPGRTGQQLGQDLRKRCPKVKILVTSGYCDAEYETEEPGAQTFFLAKPYSRRGLVEKIEKILGVAPFRRAADQAS